MNKQLLAVIISLVEEAIKLEPGIVLELQAIFAKPNPTPDDWNAARASILSKNYSDFVPDSALPPDPAPPAPPAP